MSAFDMFMSVIMDNSGKSGTDVWGMYNGRLFTIGCSMQICVQMSSVFYTRYLLCRCVLLFCF